MHQKHNCQPIIGEGWEGRKVKQEVMQAWRGSQGILVAGMYDNSTSIA